MCRRVCVYVAEILILGFGCVPLLLHLHRAVCPPLAIPLKSVEQTEIALRCWGVLISPKGTTSLILSKVLESNLIL